MRASGVRIYHSMCSGQPRITKAIHASEAGVLYSSRPTTSTRSTAIAPYPNRTPAARNRSLLNRRFLTVGPAATSPCQREIAHVPLMVVQPAEKRTQEACCIAEREGKKSLQTVARTPRNPHRAGGFHGEQP